MQYTRVLLILAEWFNKPLARIYISSFYMGCLSFAAGLLHFVQPKDQGEFGYARALRDEGREGRVRQGNCSALQLTNTEARVHDFGKGCACCTGSRATRVASILPRRRN